MDAMHLDGSSDPARIEDLAALLHELHDADDEQDEVSVGDPYGWSVSAFASGTVVLDHAAHPDDAQHVRDDVPRDEMLAIFTEIATGQVDAALARAWTLE